MNWGTTLLVVPFALACVNGGDDSNSKAPGTLGGPCFANNTCNAALTCTLENGSGVCEQPDATMTDVGASDSPSTSDASDAGVDACNVTEAFGLLCSSKCAFASDGGGGCCPKPAGCVTDDTTCTGNFPVWKCQSAADCSNVSCCVGGSFTASCPPMLSFTVTDPPVGAECAATCATNQFTLCATSNDCNANIGLSCVGVETSPFGVNVGLCLPQQ